MNGDNCRKAFHFDLDQAKLKEFYPSKSKNGYKKAWADIRTFMENHGFVHTQYSGYETADIMPYLKAYGVIEKLNEEFPWFLKCAQVATLTEIGKRYDAIEHLHEQLTVKDDASHPALKSKVSLLDEVSSMREASKELNNDLDIGLQHDDLER
ncbi:hypothetical protein [Streptococcus uberis]